MIYGKDEHCRRCLLRESGGNDEYEQVKRCIDKIKPDEKADNEQYKLRLSLCAQCGHLIGGTCMKCGCYVELRAAYISNRCPLAGKNRKW